MEINQRTVARQEDHNSPPTVSPNKKYRSLFFSPLETAGYYAGYIASSFTFGRFLTAYVWGHASDSIGRKPVVLIGLSAIVVCSVAFGLSTSFAMAIASRCVCFRLAVAKFVSKSSLSLAFCE